MHSPIWLLVFEAETTPLHPLYWKIEQAWIQVAIVAEDEQDALSRSLDILRSLPYADISEAVRVQQLDPGETPEGLEQLLNQARSCGIGFRVVATRVGADRTEP